MGRRRRTDAPRCGGPLPILLEGASRGGETEFVSGARRMLGSSIPLWRIGTLDVMIIICLYWQCRHLQNINSYI
jgi:hypothetical protein